MITSYADLIRIKNQSYIIPFQRANFFILPEHKLRFDQCDLAGLGLKLVRRKIKPISAYAGDLSFAKLEFAPIYSS